MTTKLRIVIFDVDHGNSTFIETPNGKRILIDLGAGSLKENNKTFSPLYFLSQYWGIDYIDELVITHPHKDHLDDIYNLRLITFGYLNTPRHLTDDEILQYTQQKDAAYVSAYLDLRRTYSFPVSPERLVTSPASNGGVTIQYFYPRNCGISNLNNHSIVCVVQYASSKVVIPGDNESPSWNELLLNPTFVNAISGADILVASHHGRDAGYCENIFDHFKPKLTIISDGPGGDTSATSSYYVHSKGWEVYSRSTSMTVGTRYCLTTRSDKGIDINLGYYLDGRAFMNVTVD